jgi:diguanylate cyclase (GGDEF)-like protein
MRKLIPVFSPSEPDPHLLGYLAIVERTLIGIVALTALVNLAGWFIPALGRLFPPDLPIMKSESAVLALVIALSLYWSGDRQSAFLWRLSRIAASLVLLFCLAVLAEHVFDISIGIDTLLPSAREWASITHPRVSPQSAGSFALLGLIVIVIRARKGIAGLLSDVFTACLCLITVILTAGYLYGAFHIFGTDVNIHHAKFTLLCVALLCLAALIRRTEAGVFSILVGRGFGSRILRVFAPVALVAPFLREAARAIIIGRGRTPTPYLTATLASFNALVAFALVFFLAWRISRMETEIRGLSLRDELTGLYNLRGFRLLAEQALRLAQRAELPFSVLFVDLDDLKQVNDSLGHQTGSQFLIETAKILTATFRETDVISRIGGDELVVAGQFDQSAISAAVRRLEEAAKQRNIEAGRKAALSFSIGHVTLQAGRRQSLDEMLLKADRAMYAEKRRKKATRSFNLIPSNTR